MGVDGGTEVSFSYPGNAISAAAFIAWNNDDWIAVSGDPGLALPATLDKACVADLLGRVWRVWLRAAGFLQ